MPIPGNLLTTAMAVMPHTDVDQDNRPILFDDTVRPFMFEFMAKRINIQLNRLKALNPNAFIFIDEPGLQFIFSAMSGYGEQKAKTDLKRYHLS